MAVEQGACVPAPGGRNKMNFKTSIFQMILLYFCGPASIFKLRRQKYSIFENKQRNAPEKKLLIRINLKST